MSAVENAAGGREERGRSRAADRAESAHSAETVEIGEMVREARNAEDLRSAAGLNSGALTAGPSGANLDVVSAAVLIGPSSASSIDHRPSGRRLTGETGARREAKAVANALIARDPSVAEPALLRARGALAAAAGNAASGPGLTAGRSSAANLVASRGSIGLIGPKAIDHVLIGRVLIGPRAIVRVPRGIVCVLIDCHLRGLIAATAARGSAKIARSGSSVRGANSGHAKRAASAGSGLFAVTVVLAGSSGLDARAGNDLAARVGNGAGHEVSHGAIGERRQGSVSRGGPGSVLRIVPRIDPESGQGSGPRIGPGSIQGSDPRSGPEGSILENGAATMTAGRAIVAASARIAEAVRGGNAVNRRGER